MGAVDGLAHWYLRWADRLLPGRVVGFYVVGSAALGAFRPGRSDLDFVAVLDRKLETRELIALRCLHGVASARTALRAVAQANPCFPGTCNGVFVDSAELARPVSRIVPVASHTAALFEVGAGFDVNPVMWKVFSESGLRFRGPDVIELGLDPEPQTLRAWNLKNLRDYWKPLAVQLGSQPGLQMRIRPRWWTAWCVLGVPRLYHTIATGKIVSKEEAGLVALEVFHPKWHPIIQEGLAYRDGRPIDGSLGGRVTRLRVAAEFVLEVIESADRL